MQEDSLESLEAVFDRHFDDVYRYVAYRLAPHVDAAQDVTQEVFLAALRNWASYQGEGSVLAWLRAIARHKVADHLRLRGKREGEADQEALGRLDAAGDSGPQERAILLAQVMRSLPPRHVELLEEKYLDGLSVRQIARKHGRTEKAVQSALARARQALRDEFLRQQTRQEHRDEPTRF